LNTALAAVANTTGEALIGQFSEALDAASRDCTTTEPWDSHSRSRQGSQDSQHQGFDGIGTLPALQRLQGLAVWLRGSALHQGIWDEEIGLRLGIDNRTRWSSCYQLIDGAIRKRPLITQFMADHEDSLGHHSLRAADWDILQKAHQFLRPFASSNIYEKHDVASISQCLSLMDALLLHFHIERVSYGILCVALLTQR
jgi:hypothetical protein